MIKSIGKSIKDVAYMFDGEAFSVWHWTGEDFVNASSMLSKIDSNYKVWWW